MKQFWIITILFCHFHVGNAKNDEVLIKYFPFEIKDYPLLFVDTIEQVKDFANYGKSEFWPIPNESRVLIEKFNNKQKSIRKVNNIMVSPQNLDLYSVDEYRYLIKPIHRYDALTVEIQTTRMDFQLIDRKNNKKFPVYEKSQSQRAHEYLNDLNRFIRITSTFGKEDAIKKLEKELKWWEVAGYVGLIALGPIIAVLLDA